MASKFHFKTLRTLSVSVWLLARRLVPPSFRVSGWLILDLAVVLGALFGAASIGAEAGVPSLDALTPLTVVTLLIGTAVIFTSQGLYRSVIRYMGQQAVWDLVKAVSFSTLTLAAAIFFTDADLPATAALVYWLLLFVGVGGSRLISRAWHQSSAYADARRVIIYGAGESGRQLLNALNQGTDYRVVAFIDDNPSLHETVINGRLVLGSDDLPSLVQEHAVRQVLLAIPSASQERRRAIINSLGGLPVRVRTIPKISELISGNSIVNQIQDVDLDDLLGREPVPPHPELIDRCITDKVVMVTGAGGSIGSELCRQILASSPKELILLDISEFALYSVDREIKSICQRQGLRFPVVTLLGSVRDEQRLESIFRIFSVDTVYHAAAYKHVPMVEYNVAEGVANNVHGTWSAAWAAHRADVDTFVLVSTDKAVRPTNVMGASKRFAELILQGLSQIETQTRFCIVRFGNVLGSSGSVIPLFREQISSGGPVTVTHPEVSRYFMSIREAAQLVLQAGALGTGGDVFVLDMGEPVRITELAERMIRLSGYDIERDNMFGEHIDIEYIGLRPGEKLHEELLLGTSVTGTGHPMIMRAEEESFDFDFIEDAAHRLLRACAEMDLNDVTSIFTEHVLGFSGHEPRHDYVWVKQGRVGKRVRKMPEAENVTPIRPELVGPRQSTRRPAD
ncbi:MAG: nucleoside-diphosphate sugar epimerase [Halieaceae bacterium]|nr:nucleoside-diphosphate sugar epimerase [Halieaceae bacterium]